MDVQFPYTHNAEPELMYNVRNTVRNYYQRDSRNVEQNDIIALCTHIDSALDSDILSTDPVNMDYEFIRVKLTGAFSCMSDEHIDTAIKFFTDAGWSCSKRWIGELRFYAAE